MKVLIASEFRCTIYKNEYYLAPKGYYIYKNYADSFGDVILVSRFTPVDALPEGYQKASFIVDIVNIPKLSDIIFGTYDDEIVAAIKKSSFVITRVPSIIAYKTALICRKLGRKYLAEAMGDAWDAYWNHGILGKIVAPYMHYEMKKTVWKANYTIYVTRRYLQNRYPSNAPSISASNVVIRNEDQHSIIERRREVISKMNRNNLKLMTTGAIDVFAKGQQYVVSAIPILKKQGINVQYFLAGSGDAARLKRLAVRKHVMENVVFLGELPMEKVYEYLDMIDIYVQPSLQEGLPRAVIEAMSRACPCIGSNTAGTPELLPPECIFRRKSITAVAKKTMEILNADMANYASKNLERSTEYLEDNLKKRRQVFFEMIKHQISHSE